jgi:dipeptidyl aminopeptidase/acylaminoacyl peptidase
MHKTSIFKHLLIISISISYIQLSAQKLNKSALKINEIMQGANFVGNLPGDPFWSFDNKKLYFEWNPEKAISDLLYEYELSEKQLAKVSFDTEWSLPSKYLVYSPDKKTALYQKHGDLYLLDLSNGKTFQVTNTLERESSPHYTDFGTKIAFRKNDNLYTWQIINGQLEQVTNFVSKNDKSAYLNKKDKWLQNDQLSLFEVIKQRDDKAKLSKTNAEKNKLNRPLEIPLKGMNLMEAQMSPDGNYVSYILYKRERSKRTNVPNYVTKSGYTEDINARAKVGSRPSKFEMHIYDIKQRKTYKVDFSTLDGINDVPKYTKDYPDKIYENKNRVGYINEPIWNATGTKAFIEMRANDNKDRWIALLDIKTGKLETLDRQHDEAWIDGPGIGYFSNYRTAMGWMPDNESIWFQSEETGYSHLYVLNTKTGKKKALTKGNFEIFNPHLSNDKKHWYFSSNEVHPGEVHFYRMPLKGGKAQKLTEMTGANHVFLSPDESKMAIKHSFSNKPWELYIKNNPISTGNEEKAVQITNSLTDEFKEYEWRVPENITFKAEDGKSVHARLYKPVADQNNKAAVIFVHGAGYLQNAHKWWSVYYREYMFNNILVDNGFTVLDIDYRGSAGYGRDWRTAVYRHMGGKDLSDQVDGAKYLIKNHDIDPEKVGIYGGSYGGFITIMAMFKAADTFKAGAAIRSVTDWAHYNHGYTANILNTPATDSLAYRRSSPIYYAEGLKGHLLMLHGMIDDNVHFQDVVRLSQRLIELGKKNWDVAIYPVERHGFVEPSSWTDEYNRIFDLFKKTLLKD